MQLRAALIGGVLASLALACNEEDSAGQPTSLVIDAGAGTVNDAGLGNGRHTTERELGNPSAAGRLLSRVPEHLSIEDLGLPWTLDPIPGVPRARVQTLRYGGMSVLVAPGHGAYAFFIWRSGTQTTRGVRIGDSLKSATRHYRGLRCATRNRNSEYVPYRYCAGRVGKTYLWFGQNPIRSISVSATPLG